MAPTPPHLGDFFRLRRDERGWTQDALARKSGISSATIYRAEQAAAKGIPVSPWKARFLIPVIAALHEKERLTEEQMTDAIIAAGIPEADRREVEHAIRKKAGEFDGLQQRLQAQTDAASDTLLGEFASLKDTSELRLTHTVLAMCRIYGSAKVAAALAGMKAAFDAEARAASNPAAELARVPLPPNSTELVDRTPRPKTPPKKR